MIMCYRAKVQWYCDEELITDSCITFGENLAEAMAHITKYFGEKDIEEVYLSCLCDEAVLPLDEKIIDSLELY